MTKFHISHGFIKGDTHVVCEDYATSLKVRGRDLSVEDGNPLVIVSDGCSAVANADIGSRLLTLAAKKVLTRVIADQEVPEPAELGEMILQSMVPAAEVLEALDTCFATLLVGFVLDGQCHVYAYGDGLWYWRSRSGELHVTGIEDVQNCPPYLIFKHESTPGVLFEPDAPRANRIRVFESPSGKMTMTNQEQFHWSLPMDDVAEFGVATDGMFAVSGENALDVVATLSGSHIPGLFDKFLEGDPLCYDDIGIAAIRILHE